MTWEGTKNFRGISGHLCCSSISSGNSQFSQHFQGKNMVRRKYSQLPLSTGNINDMFQVCGIDISNEILEAS